MQPKKSKCKQWFLGIFIVFIVIYTAVWYFASQFLQDKITNFLQFEQKINSQISCTDLNKSGYPLRVGVNCQNFTYQKIASNSQDSDTIFRISTRKLDATAPIYALKWAKITATSPAYIQVPGLLPINANWKELELSSDIDKELPNKINLFGENLLIATKDDNGNDSPLFSASFLRLEADGLKSNLNLQLAFDKVQLPYTLPKTNAKIPAFEGMLRVQLNDAVDVLGNRPSNFDDIKQRLYGHSGTVERAEIALETGGRMTISGPYSIDDLGYLNANFDIAVGDINALSLSAKQMFPAQSRNIDTIIFVINTMPKNKLNEPLLNVTIKNGEAKLGYIKLGNINPL